MLLPIPVLINFLVGLLSLLLLAAGIGLCYWAYRRYQNRLRHLPIQQLAAKQSVSGGVVVETDEDAAALSAASSRTALRDQSVWVPLAAGLGLLLFTFFGKEFVRLSFRSGQDEPKQLHSAVMKDVSGPGGEHLHVEIFGREDAPTLVLTHGWSTSETEWYYAKRQLAGQFRLIVWDLPGLGASTGLPDGIYSLDRMSRDLKAVVALANGKPVILVGHSIGGMINLTYCRLFPQDLGSTVAGIVQVDTSYTNPVTTTKNASQSEALQKPVGEPLLHLMSLFSPLVRAMNWLSYQNGISHLMNANSAFAGSETWGQVDLIARYGYESSPDVVARGTLAMFHWDAKAELAQIPVPVLVLVGQQDTTTLPSASVFMKDHLPHAQLLAISPSAHYGLLEQNGRYNEAIAHFSSNTLKSVNP